MIALHLQYYPCLYHRQRGRKQAAARSATCQVTNSQQSCSQAFLGDITDPFKAFTLQTSFLAQIITSLNELKGTAISKAN